MTEKKIIYSKKFNIRWGDMDAYGHMNNTKYFLYTQEARFELMTEKNIKIDPQGVAAVLATTSCQFLLPIVYPETILVEMHLLKNEGKKSIMEHIIKSATKPNLTYAILEDIIIWYDFKLKKTVEVPDIFKNLGL